MKKSLYIKMSLCNRAYDFTNVIESDEEQVVELHDSSLGAVLQEIFSVDPVSGLPKGDIAYFLSKDGNPQVKAWLETNLLQPRRQVAAKPEGVTEELIVEFSRQPGESNLDFASRLASIRDEAMENIKKYNEQHSKDPANE